MYTFASDDAAARWRDPAARRVVDRSLGYPIVVCDEDGRPVAPPAGVAVPLAAVEVAEELGGLGADGTAGGVEARESPVDGRGVFATKAAAKGQLLGVYGGTVFTEEEWEAGEPRDENFLFNLNDGEQAVLLDGSTGGNALKWLNHGCAPNVLMQEAFARGAWHVLVWALQDLAPGVELLHDFALHTEDEAEAATPCRCGAAACRGKLFRFFEW